MVHPLGPTGDYGPNDSGYINGLVRHAAELLRHATQLYCQGHYPHSNARDIPADHGLVRALQALAEVDSQTAQSGNRTHEPLLFVPCRPTEADKHRWDAVPADGHLPSDVVPNFVTLSVDRTTDYQAALHRINDSQTPAGGGPLIQFVFKNLEDSPARRLLDNACRQACGLPPIS